MAGPPPIITLPEPESPAHSWRTTVAREWTPEKISNAAASFVKAAGVAAGILATTIVGLRQRLDELWLKDHGAELEELKQEVERLRESQKETNKRLDRTDALVVKVNGNTMTLARWLASLNGGPPDESFPEPQPGQWTRRNTKDVQYSTSERWAEQ